MKKLKLNKKTVSVLDKKEMRTVNGGNATIITDPGDGGGEFLSIASCRASRSGRDCCSSGPCV
jgi:natural product precursor